MGRVTSVLRKDDEYGLAGREPCLHELFLFINEHKSTPEVDFKPLKHYEDSKAFQN